MVLLDGVRYRESGPIDAIIAATNQALWDLRARKENLPLRKLLNKKAPGMVPAYGSGLNPSDCIEATERARNEGYRSFKLKIRFGAARR
jgi:D-galactarolactone cycloisomerase